MRSTPVLVETFARAGLGWRNLVLIFLGNVSLLSSLSLPGRSALSVSVIHCEHSLVWSVSPPLILLTVASVKQCSGLTSGKLIFCWCVLSFFAFFTRDKKDSGDYLFNFDI